MTEFNPRPISEVELRAAYVENTLRPEGFLNDIAQNVLRATLDAPVPEDPERAAKQAAGRAEILAAHPELAEGPANLSPREAGNILLPPKQPGEASEARWQLAEGASDIVKAGAAEHADEIFQLADQIDLRKAESISQADVVRIAPIHSVWLVEGGANRTAAVRLELANQTARAVYGAHLEWINLYQFGLADPIPKILKGQPNPEYKIAQEIAGDYLPEDDSLTRFGLNVASALQGGYELIEDTDGGEVAARIVQMRKKGVPNLTLIQPHVHTRGFEDAFTTMSDGYGLNMDGLQFVMFTNGQYRPKDEQQATKWAERRGISMLPPVAIGDEAGFTVEQGGKKIVTKPRGPMIYLNEAVILERLS